MVRVTVIGIGSLGIKITGELAYHGHEVRLYDENTETLNRVHLRLNEDKRALKEDGLLTQSDFVGEVYCLSRLEEAVKDAEFIFEAVAEELSVKQDLFERISHCCRRDAILATNTMRLPIESITERAAYRERCLGVRFLYPVYCIPEVEIIVGQQTSIQTLEKVRIFLERMGKIAFFRSGSEPLVLTEEQREARRNTYVRYLKKNKGQLRKARSTVPDLASDTTILNVLNGEQNIPISKEKDCVVCMDEERNCVLHPCHHLCTCANCGRMLLKRQDACPICRRHISSIFRVFHS